jgi:hypothetical protein
MVSGSIHIYPVGLAKTPKQINPWEDQVELALNGVADAVQAGLSEAGMSTPLTIRGIVHICQTPKLES